MKDVFFTPYKYQRAYILVRYTLPEGNTQIYTSKYMAYMLSEEELKRELNLDAFKKLNE